MTRTMEGHRLRVGALSWSSSQLSSGSRDKSILQRDIRAQDDYVSKLSGHKSEVRLPSCFSLFKSFLSGVLFYFCLHLDKQLLLFRFVGSNGLRIAVN